MVEEMTEGAFGLLFHSIARIYGVPSDPVKMQQVREIMRARSECVENNICNVSDYRYKKQKLDSSQWNNFSFRFFNFSRLLTKGPEHTWGKALSGYLKDYKMNWHNKEVLHAATAIVLKRISVVLSFTHSYTLPNTLA